MLLYTDSWRTGETCACVLKWLTAQWNSRHIASDWGLIIHVVLIELVIEEKPRAESECENVRICLCALLNKSHTFFKDLTRLVFFLLFFWGQKTVHYSKSCSWERKKWEKLFGSFWNFDHFTTFSFSSLLREMISRMYIFLWWIKLGFCLILF